MKKNIKQEPPLVTIDEKGCVTCYACVRVCPVDAIRVKKNDYPEVVTASCIGCGNCLNACPTTTIHYRSNVAETKKILADKQNKTIAIVSPSIAGEFDDITDYRKFVQMIRTLGISKVHEVSFGVDLIAYQYKDLFANFKGKYYITSVDPVVVNYIEKYKPGLVDNLAPLVSPMIATAKVIKSIYGNDVKLIYFGPEIATKNEALRYKNDAHIDAVLTFTELRQLFREYNITEANLEFSDFDPPLGYKGSLYPLVNGLIQAADLDENLLSKQIITLEGEEEMISGINEFEKSIDTIQKHFYVSFGNSLLGPGMSKSKNRLQRQTFVVNYANKRLRNFFRFEWNKNLEKYQKVDFSATFKPDDQRLKMPDENEINAILDQLDKSTNSNFGCERCGFGSCRDFAIAIARGVAKPEMCTTFAHNKLIQFEQTLNSKEKKLTELTKALNDSTRKFQQEKDVVEYTSELMNSVIQKLRAGIIIADENLKVIKTNLSFINMMGEELKEVNEVVPGLEGADLKSLLPFNAHNLFTFVLKNNEVIENRDMDLQDKIFNVSIFPIREHKIVGAIIRDMSSPEVQKAEVITRVSEVIDKNLEMVQKIGFLLGEGASEIEKELNSIIDFYKNSRT
ncbi:MAG: [Fe-Fe] hydrogenase large subunit C-terminal domain-containing protein [Bacteroidota bacterium]